MMLIQKHDVMFLVLLGTLVGAIVRTTAHEMPQEHSEQNPQNTDKMPDTRDRSRQPRSYNIGAFTIERFIQILQTIEDHPEIPYSSAENVTKYLRFLSYSNMTLENLCEEYIGDLSFLRKPEEVLPPEEIVLLKRMIIHRINETDNSELGVVLTDAKDTVALGPIINGIRCGGFRRDEKLNSDDLFMPIDIDNVFVSTLADDIAKTTLFNYSNKANSYKALFGPNGNWDSLSNPDIYTLSGNASTATDAEILADIDGLLLGLSIPDIMPKELRLSEIFRSYYGGEGLGPIHSIKDSNRIENFKIAILDNSLADQTVAVMKVYAHQNNISKANTAYIFNVLQTFYELEFMRPCTTKVKHKYTVGFFIEIIQIIEGQTHYEVRQMVDSLLWLNGYFSSDYYDIMLSTESKHEPKYGFYWHLITEMINRRVVSQGKRELGVVRDSNKETLSMGHVVAGIAAGLYRNSTMSISNVSPELDTLFGVTVSGTLAQSITQTSNNEPVIAEKGYWDINCPPRYMRNTKISHHAATPAAIIGDIDGFALGQNIITLMKQEPHLKLSTVLRQYYGTGLNGDDTLSSKKRIQAFKAMSREPEKVTKETASSCMYLRKMKSGRFYDSESCRNLAANAVNELYSKILEVKEAAVNYSCFGNIMDAKPTGASTVTANQYGLTEIGVMASIKLIDGDINELNNRIHCYEQVGRSKCIHPALIAALASRESRGGLLIKSTAGYGMSGDAYGILQCHVNNSIIGNDCQRYDWDTCEHIDMMVDKVLLTNIRRVKRKYPSWPPVKQLQGGVAAYNNGVEDIHSWENLDIGTTGNDFSNDVIARAQRLVTKHGWTYGTIKDRKIEKYSVTACERLAVEGNCEIYKCMEQYLQCGSKGFALGYGLPFCNRISSDFDQFSQKGQVLIGSVRKCLIDEFWHSHQLPSATCNKVRQISFKSHIDCYLKSNIDICEFAYENKVAVWKLYDLKNSMVENSQLALEQVFDMLSNCASPILDEIRTYLEELFSNWVLDINSIEVNPSIVEYNTYDIEADETCVSYANQGDCRFYECFEKKLSCAAIFSLRHIEEFEAGHCKVIYQNYNLFDEYGRRWVRDSERCLMQSLLPFYQGGKVNCALLHLHMSKARKVCYIDSGYCGVLDSPQNEWALQRSISYLGFPLLTPINDLQLNSYYYHNVIALNRLIAYIHSKCPVKSLTNYTNFYKLIQSEKTGKFMKLK